MDGIKVNERLKEQYIEKGYWTHETLLDRFYRTVERFGDREYVVDDRGNRYTYRQMDEASSVLASYLKEAGVKPHDVVSFQIPVWSEFVLIAVACMKAGAVMHPIGLSHEEADLVYGMNKTGSKLYFGVTFFKNKDYETRILSVKDQIPTLEQVVLLDGTRPAKSGCITLAQIMETRKPLPREQSGGMDGFDVALVLCTSGTTGGNKGVMLTHNNIIFSEDMFNRELGLDENDIMFMPAPLHHATGFHHGVIAPMLMGAKLVLEEKFTCQGAIDLMNRERCTYSMGATPFIYDIMRHMEEQGGSLPHLKFYLCGGAPVPGYMVRKADAYGIRLCEVYGSTESVPHVFVRPDEALDLDGRTSGRAMTGVEVRVVDESGQDVPPGVTGEEISRGPNVFVGYLKDQEATDRALTDDGWFYSGDLCVSDGKGNIHIVGRKKDMIVRGGENLNSNEIDNDIEGCPGVRDHAIVGMPDERMGERICAFVVTEPGVTVTLEDMTRYMIEKHVQKRYWPERVEMTDKIPRTASGKVKKYLLLEELKRRGCE